MSSAQFHKEEDALIKWFAWYATLPQAIILFTEQFGHPPTEAQIAVTNIGNFLNDRHAVFATNDRIKEFKRWRRIFNDNIENIAINNPAWRQLQYDMIYNQLLPVAMETGRWGRCIEVLAIAAKDGAGGFGQKKEITIDNRTINMNMSDAEVNRKLQVFEEALGIKLTDLALVERGDVVIDSESE